MKQTNSQHGAAHLVLILAFVVVLIGVLGYLGYNTWQKQSADAGGSTVVGTAERNAQSIRVVNTGDGAQADIMVKPGETKDTGYDVNRLVPTNNISFTFNGTPNSSYKGADIYVQNSSSGGYYALTGSSRYSVSSPSSRVGFSSDGYTINHASSRDLCRHYVRVQFERITDRSTYVKACTLNDTKVKAWK